VRRHVGVDAAHAYGGFMAHLTAWCEHHQIPYRGVPVGTIKKHATGKGNAGKDAVIAAVRAWSFDPVDDNEADALALLRWAIATQEVGHGHPEPALPLPAGQAATRSHGPGSGEATWLARPAHPRRVAGRRSARLDGTRTGATDRRAPLRCGRPAPWLSGRPSASRNASARRPARRIGCLRCASRATSTPGPRSNGCPGRISAPRR